MQTKVQKWGNSLALRIPKAFADEIAIAPDSPVEVIIIDGKLVVVPIEEPEISLEELLAGITPENMHTEVSTGTAVGNEVW